MLTMFTCFPNDDFTKYRVNITQRRRTCSNELLCVMTRLHIAVFLKLFFHGASISTGQKHHGSTSWFGLASLCNVFDHSLVFYKYSFSLISSFESPSSATLVIYGMVLFLFNVLVIISSMVSFIFTVTFLLLNCLDCVLSDCSDKPRESPLLLPKPLPRE